ncbi:MAG: hypothetical protein ACRDZX_15995 [Acidimicrobiales bacterium]
MLLPVGPDLLVGALVSPRITRGSMHTRGSAFKKIATSVPKGEEPQRAEA